MKTCIDCQQDKSLSEFNKNHSYADGYTWTCTICTNIRNKISRDKNKDRIKSRRDEFKLNNPEIVKKWKKDDYERNKEKRRKTQEIYNLKNRENVLQRHRDYYQKNKEKIKESWPEFYEKNKEKIKARQQKNRKAITTQANIYRKNKKREDPIFAIKCSFRSMTASAFSKRGYKKNSKTEQLLGCSFDVATQHIERQFKKGMTWENHGHIGKVWHIDHKIPLSSAKTEDDVIRLCHYTNLRPMWAIENLEKGRKIIPTQMILTI